MKKELAELVEAVMPSRLLNSLLLKSVFFRKAESRLFRQFSFIQSERQRFRPFASGF